MALRKNMPTRLPEDHPACKGHETTYSASRGGYYPTKDKPVPGTPKKKEK